MRLQALAYNIFNFNHAKCIFVLKFQYYIVTNSAILSATISRESSAVLNPLRDPSSGLTSLNASNVVLCTIGISKSRANNAESSLSAIPSPFNTF